MSEQSIAGQLLGKLESMHLEHRSLGVEPQKVAETVCAFLNTNGGTVLVEAGNNEAQAETRQQAIEGRLRSLVQPPSLWSVTLEKAGGEYYCLVDVPAGRDRPYTVNNKIFVRRGNTTLVASTEELRTIVESSFTEAERWERRLIPGGDVDRLDKKLVLETAEEAQRRRDYVFSDPTNVERILADLALYRRQSITQAAEVLFGLRPAVQFPQIRVRATVYASNKGGDFVDNRQFEAAALPMLESVFAVVRQHTPRASTFEGGLRRTDQPVYPEAAVREGLVNAFVHRDYTEFSGGIGVDLYPDRLVIWNTGSLPEGIKIGDLKREHPSMPRNPDIAHVFFLRGYMDRVGRGTQKIIWACEEAGMPAPQWKADQTGVTLTFLNKTSVSAVKLNLRERKLLDELQPGALIRLPEYCDRLAVSERQGRRDLGHLTETGWLEREGEGPATVFRRTGKARNPAKPGQTRP